jgi:nucleoside-diphosphate-sugar epimerase
MARFIREYEPDMMTAMVTGAAGVLGRATVRMLLEEGFRVRPISPGMSYSVGRYSTLAL